MGFFQRLFGGKKEVPPTPTITKKEVLPEKVTDNWREVPFYIEETLPEKKLVSLVATAIASEDQRGSEFVVKRILVKNPEAQLVSLIATAIASGEQPEAEFVVKKIYQK